MTDRPPEKIRSGQPSILEAALFGCCPQCGARTLFAGVTRFAPRCRVCGLDYDSFNVGDGPAAFLTLIIGGIIAGLAIWLDIAVAPPFWVHLILWVPLTVMAVLAGLRVAKALLLIAEYRNRAGEGRIKGDPRP